MKKLITLLLALSLLTGVLAGTVSSAADFPFTDVKATRWSRGAVEYAYEMKYMDGVGAGKFDPEGTMTRAMAVTVLYRREGSPAVTFKNEFSDVKSGKYYSSAVIWAKENGVVNGVTETTFDPNGKITREQLAAILFRYASVSDLDVDGREDLAKKFPDAGKAHKYAVDALSWATAAGLIGGVKKGGTDYLDPAGNATREQFAAIMQRFDSYSETAGTPLTEADYYVSPRGNDGGDGSFAHPFRTLGRAVLAVRETEKTADRGSVTVALRAGEYYLSDFDLEAEDSGAEDCPVNYVNYGDGEVTVTNGFTVAASEWKTLPGSDKTPFRDASRSKIMKVSVADRLPFGASALTTSVFGEDGELTLARFPNRYPNGGDNWLEAAADVTGTATIKIKNSMASRRISGYSDPGGVILYGAICYEEFRDKVSVGSYDQATFTVTVTDLETLRSYPWFGGLRYAVDGEGNVDEEITQLDVDLILTNAPEELDSADEYYVDYENGALYAVSPEEDLLFVSDPAGDGAAEYVAFSGVTFRDARAGMEPVIPIVYIDKTGEEGFKILNLSDPQLYDEDVDGDGGRILRETVEALIESEEPDLITVTGDLAYGGHFKGLNYFCQLMEDSGIPWAPILGNHDHQEWDKFVDQVADTLEKSDGCLFRKGSRELGYGNYVVVLRQNGAPVHGLIMMDTGGKSVTLDSDGNVETDQPQFTQKQIEWYVKVCEKLREMGVAETTVICHVPCGAYREAWAEALLPDVDPLSVPAGDGNQTGCWAPGYEDSFGVAHTDISTNKNDNGFFDKVLECGSTKTLLCGHNHTNCFSVSYKGVRLVYSLKTGSGFSWEPDMSGGTVFDVTPDGHATLRHHYVKID